MMQNYIGSDVTSMVTLPVLIFEPMIMLQKMAELMEYSYLLDQEINVKIPTCAWYMRQHWLYLFTMPTNALGSLSIPFLVRLMKW
ncbi:hypothetical protein ACS0TY_015282 [Phlomoides rotata]